MRSRAKLLAELEEKSQKNKQLDIGRDELSVMEPSLEEGYDPYDNPGTHRGMPDAADMAARRLVSTQRRSRR